MKVLLLLSGGRDSRMALDRLLAQGHSVECLCVSGRQGQEALGARRAADRAGVPLHVHHDSRIDETTWNPLKLMLRYVLLPRVVWRYLRCNDAVASGLKRRDLGDWRLAPWLPAVLLVMGVLIVRAGKRWLSPVWDE